MAADVLFPGVATLVEREASRAIAEHPELAQEGIEAPVVFVASARDRSEAAELKDLIMVARAMLRNQRLSTQDVLRALLPSDGLTVGPGLLDQVRRNAESKRALVEEFGLYSATEVAQAHGSRATNPHQLASRLRKSGRLLAVPVDGQFRYPGYQFGEDGRARPIVAEVLRALGGRLSDWEAALWFVSSNDWLGGLRPVDVLDATEADHAAVVTAARRLADEISG